MACVLAARLTPSDENLNEQMLSKKTAGGAITGLDIAAGSIAAVEVAGTSAGPAAKLEATALAPLETGAFAEGEVVAPDLLSKALKDFFAEHKLGKRVRLGVANQKVVVRTLRLPFVENPDELESAVRFKASDEIPMPLDQAVLDYRVVAYTQNDEGARQMDVIVVAARREMIEVLLDTMGRAGLRPIGIDLAAFGTIRALAERRPPAAAGSDQEPVPTTLYAAIGDGTNLAFARGRSCLFTRMSPFGVEEIAEDLSERSELTLEHARDWLVYVGLEKPLAELDLDPETGPIGEHSRAALEQGAARLLDELRLSLDFYAQQPDAPAVEQLVVTGPGAAIAGLAERLSEGLALPLRESVPSALRDESPAATHRLATAYGLALEE